VDRQRGGEKWDGIILGAVALCECCGDASSISPLDARAGRAFAKKENGRKKGKKEESGIAR